MHTLIDNARTFRDRVAPHAEEVQALAHGQSPQALFITCSDSRVIPSLITAVGPGELFELRTAGGIVPEYQPDRPSSEAATIEYAVELLGVGDIVVCGHSHCGAVGAMVRREDLSGVRSVYDWLESTAPHAIVADPAAPELALAVQSHVLSQLDRLRGHRCVARRLAEGRLRLHGWFYEVHTGCVLAHQPHDDVFLPL